MSISAHEEVRCNQYSYRIVDATDFRGAEIVVNQDSDLHPSLPLVGLLSIEETQILLSGFQSVYSDRYRGKGKNSEVESTILLVFFEEQGCTVGDEEERYRTSENSEGKKVFLIWEEG